jgi:hypothetical protein
MDIGITKYCTIKNNRISVNGALVFEDTGSANFGEFIRMAYKFAAMSYPKFYKMDNLCKLALVATEILLKDEGIIEKYGKENIGVVFQNASSTIETDMKFQSTIDDRTAYFPSPADFVYTLPNIMIGEICIKHKLFGENALFIEKHFKPIELVRYIDFFIKKNFIKAAIAGYVEQNGNDYNAFLYLVEPIGSESKANIQQHHADFLHEIYAEI